MAETFRAAAVLAALLVPAAVAPAQQVRRSDIEREVSELLATRPPADESFTGYEKGFGIDSADGLFSLRINGRIQARYTYEDFDSDSDLQDRASFSVPRARLKLKGHAWDPRLRYTFQMDLNDKQDGGRTILRDAYIDWGPGESWGIRAGQFKAPFGRQELTSSGNLQLVDRSLANNRFAPGRQVGAMLHGQAGGGRLEYYGGLFNGDGEDRQGNTNDNNQSMIVARVQFNPLGPWKLSEGDFGGAGEPAVSLGAGYVYNPQGDDGRGFEIDSHTFGLDGALRFLGLSIQGEWYYRTTNDDGAPAGADFRQIDETGYYVQTGYFLIPETLEIAGRYSSYDFEDDLADFDQQEIRLGVSYYFHHHDHKLQLDLTRFTDDPSSGSTIDDNILRLQWQLKF